MTSLYTKNCCYSSILLSSPSSAHLFAIGRQIGGTLGVLVGDGGSARAAARRRGGRGVATSGTTGGEATSRARASAHKVRAARAGSTNRTSSTSIQNSNHRLSRGHAAIGVLRGSLDPVVFGCKTWILEFRLKISRVNPRRTHPGSAAGRARPRHRSCT